MKNTTIRIRLVFLIPFIIAGLALLAAIGSYHIGRSSAQALTMANWFAGLWYAGITGIAFILGVVVLRPLLKPADKLVAETEQSQVTKDLSPPKGTTRGSQDEAARFAEAVQHVSELLGRLEAERLFPTIVGHSRRLLSVLSLTHKVAPSEASVLIVGESGTGKELVARGVHDHSHRRTKPFIPVNCAAIAANLLESELFGHEKGAFTGASCRRTGMFEAADGGTLFLDEIGDMALDTQAKILRAIEQREIQRLGGSATVPVDVRIVAATNRDLAAMIQRGEFREDLFFRINVFNVVMPPLRERREDIPLLATHFLRHFGKDLAISPEASAVLTAYTWPGNVRELRNAIETASVLADDVMLPEHLPPAVADRAQAMPDIPDYGDLGHNLDERLAEFERAMIIDALSRTGGVQARAAERLGITPRSLWHRVAKLQIDVAALKEGTR